MADRAVVLMAASSLALKVDSDSRAVGVAASARAMRMARCYGAGLTRVALWPPTDDGDGGLHLGDEDGTLKEQK
jgi:hypothetical protein